VNNITTSLKSIIEQLSQRYTDEITCQAHAWWFLELVTHKTKAELLAHDTVLSAAQRVHLTRLLERHLVQHEPLAYLIGFVPFGSLTIAIRPPILIPRPETEEWCTNLIASLQPLAPQKLTILDMCTGSGCIALSIAAALPNAHVWAVDISQQACDLTRENARKNNIDNITVVQSDLFVALPADLTFDLIVGNPPYVSQEEWHTLEPSVAEWEDKIALVGGDDGTAIVAHIAAVARTRLKQISPVRAQHLPQLVLEIGYLQAQIMQQVVGRAGFLAEVGYDAAHYSRYVVGFLKSD